MKGRKPTPPPLKLLNGNPGKRPIEQEPESPLLPADDSPPEWLHPDAQGFYREIVGLVNSMKVGTEADRLGIVALAQSLAEVKIAHEQMNRYGRVIKDKSGGATRNPYAVHAAQFIGFVRQFITEYGLTPCSRARLIAKAEGGEEDPFSKYMSGGKK
jgi:P27 family predicted phage terminase small subunit